MHRTLSDISSFAEAETVEIWTATRCGSDTTALYPESTPNSPRCLFVARFALKREPVPIGLGPRPALPPLVSAVISNSASTALWAGNGVGNMDSFCFVLDSFVLRLAFVCFGALPPIPESSECTQKSTYLINIGI